MISLEAATRTCKVDTASAARLESDRFLNPHNVVCPNWTGKDLAGRQVTADSFYTKRAGCNSAADRVIVENMLRPLETKTDPDCLRVCTSKNKVNIAVRAPLVARDSHRTIFRS